MHKFSYHRILPYLIVILLNSTITELNGQSISNSIPENVDKERIYLFYLHGAIVQEQGRNAVSEYYGRYEYTAILDALKNRGFHVVSEVREKGTKEADYAIKVKLQVDTLESLGVPPENIVIVGASMGAYIALEVALLKRDPKLRFVLMGLCSDYALNRYSGEGTILYGKYLSIFEKSDSKKSCQPIFKNQNKNAEFTEIELTMGIDHAFLFRPYSEWIDPLTEWVRNGSLKASYEKR